jgi:hypothetical protein
MVSKRTLDQRVADATGVYTLSFYTLCFLSILYHEGLQSDQKGCTGHCTGHLLTFVVTVRYSITENMMCSFSNI